MGFIKATFIRKSFHKLTEVCILEFSLKRKNDRHEEIKVEHGKLITETVFHLTVGVDLFLFFCGPPKPFTHVT